MLQKIGYQIILLIYISFLTTRNFLYAQETGTDNPIVPEIVAVENIPGEIDTSLPEPSIQEHSNNQEAGGNNSGDSSNILPLGSEIPVLLDSNQGDTTTGLEVEYISGDTFQVPQKKSETEDLATQMQIESDPDTLFLHDTNQFLKFVGTSIIPNAAYNEVSMHQNFVFSSPIGNIQALISKDTIIKTSDKQFFNLAGFGIGEGSKQLTKQVEVVDSEGNVIIKDIEHEGFEFGINGQHLIFSKPVQLTMGTALEDGAELEISVKHEGDINFNTQGLSTDPMSECDEQGNSTMGNTKVIAMGGKITFYTCGASVFSVTYVGGASFANFADASIAPGYIDKTVNFSVGSSFPAGSLIKDVNVTLDFRPIDSQNPTSFGTTNCYPTEKYFRLSSPVATQVNIITAASLTTPTTNCPRVNLVFDDEAAAGLGGNYNRTSGSSWKPSALLSAFDNQSPFGNRTLRMGDNANADGVILYGFTVTIEVYDQPLCIISPNQTIVPTYQVKNVDQTWEYQFDYFKVQDPKGLNSGYYTTLQMGNLNGPNSQVIPNTQIQWKADPIVLVTGTANSSVVLGSTMGTYHLATATDTFIKRDTAANSNKTGTYGSKLRLKMTIPAYTRPGTYSGNITYTLYEN